MNKVLATLVVLAGLVGPEAALASATPGQHGGDTRMSEFGEARAPIGYQQFCEDFPADCAGLEAGPARAHLTPERWRELIDVNDDVNTAIEPATDMEVYGVQEHWTYPVDRGDCEDYVLLKRRMLLDRGWPASALLITVVRDEMGDGHAILTVATSAGDLILDNQHAEIRFWHDTPYDFVKRQSKMAPDTWVSLREAPARHEVPVAGMEPR